VELLVFATTKPKLHVEMEALEMEYMLTHPSAARNLDTVALRVLMNIATAKTKNFVDVAK
jgi:hypothetical protein